MATSQFTIYSSSDVGGPGLMTGWSGSLIRILDACLVDGYSGKTKAGWTHPIANSASFGPTSVYACYKPPSGSMMTLFVNDNFPNITALGREAWLTGWENMTSLCNTTPVLNVGAGTGQFPTPAQQLTTGHVVCRKSSLSDNTTGHYWVMFADAYTFYLCIQTGDTTGYYYSVTFGDVFSFKGSTDAYRCLLIGRVVENVAGVGNTTSGNNPATSTNDSFAASWGDFPSGGGSYNVFLPIYLPGHFMPRTFGGGGASINVGKTFDMSKASSSGFVGNGQRYGLVPMYGFLQTPNGSDNSLYISPVTIHDPLSLSLRGRMRGFWFVAHPIINFSDGQTFQGAGDYAGKTFMIVKTDPTGGFFAIETSNTVETN